MLEVAVLVCLRSSCSFVSEGGKTVGFERLALNVVMQYDGDFVDVLVL